MPELTFPFVASGAPVVLATPDQLRRTARRVSQLKGRQPDGISLQEVRLLLGPTPPDGYRRDLLIEYLHLLNDAYRCLYERHLVALASAMKLPMAEVFEVATFYHHFEVLSDDQTPAALTVRVCDSLSCAMTGSVELMAQLVSFSGDAVRVIAAPCLGRCEQAPAVLVGQTAVPKADVVRVLAACKLALNPSPVPVSPWQEVTPFIGFQTYRAQGGYALATALMQGKIAAEDVLKTMEDSGLRGLGGAGFPAGRKWRIVREQPAPRVMAVNIDEGEPGTFKDRTYLEHDPHRFLEGVLIAAQVVGIDTCYLYLRDEYHAARQMLAREMAALQADPPCALPHLELRRGAGAYICGEESAMIESLEGKRGEPRLRPPYLAQVGLFGKPTLEHNFETLYWVRDLVEKGPQWFSRFGRRGRQGFRSFSVSGRVNLPGVKVAPAGVSVQELIDHYCGGLLDGHTLYAYLPGGASGGILPAHLNHLPLDFDTLQPYGCFIGSAAIVVLSQHDRARDAALNAMQFFADESCGQCTPCRVGTVKAARLMAAAVWDNATLDDLNAVMAEASICGLGQAAPNAVRCVQQYFPHEISG